MDFGPPPRGPFPDPSDKNLRGYDKLHFTSPDQMPKYLLPFFCESGVMVDTRNVPPYWLLRSTVATGTSTPYIVVSDETMDLPYPAVVLWGFPCWSQNLRTCDLPCPCCPPPDKIYFEAFPVVSMIRETRVYYRPPSTPVQKIPNDGNLDWTDSGFRKMGWKPGEPQTVTDVVYLTPKGPSLSSQFQRTPLSDSFILGLLPEATRQMKTVKRHAQRFKESFLTPPADSPGAIKAQYQQLLRTLRVQEWHPGKEPPRSDSSPSFVVL